MYVFWRNLSQWCPTRNLRYVVTLTDCHKNRYTGVSGPDKQKVTRYNWKKRNRKPAILHLVAILVIFHIFTLMYLYQGFHQINFNLFLLLLFTLKAAS